MRRPDKNILPQRTQRNAEKRRGLTQRKEANYTNFGKETGIYLRQKIREIFAPFAPLR